MQSLCVRNGGKPPRMALLLQRHDRRERQQSKKAEWRFQHQHDGEIKPHPVRVAVTENESRAAGAERKKDQPAKVEPRRHEQPAQGHPGGAVSDEIQRVRGLIQRKEKVKAIDDDGRQENAFPRPLPARAAPGAEFRLALWSLGQREPARAQRKRSEGKKQQTGREFREQSPGQAQPEESSVLAGRLSPE